MDANKHIWTAAQYFATAMTWLNEGGGLQLVATGCSIVLTIVLVRYYLIKTDKEKKEIDNLNDK